MVFIKQIIIQGFKSYKDQTVIEPFSSKHNVIVGRNGSGKSNFFAAIRFVLSDAYTQMGREERQALLHEGSGSAVMSAYVEVIFDNSDERFPTGKPELVLRRTIGLKKDEYSLDRKSATKSDVMNLLESAGFSRSNPYYIVPQGRVTALTNMRDSERLTLLKDVAGTQVYEARRLESMKIMDETHNKRARIDDLLDYIKERLAELEEEKDELREYQERDREKRCLEYTIYHHEQQRVQAELDQLDEQRQTGVDETDENREQFMQGEQELAEIDDAISQLKQQMDFLMVDKRDLETERSQSVKSRAQIELDVDSLNQNQVAAQSAKQRHDQELKDVQDQIQQREQELERIMPDYNSKKSEEAAVKAQLDEAESARKRLYDKQSRSTQYRTKGERDAYLQSAIDDINMRLAESKANVIEMQEDIAKYDKEIRTLEEEISDLRMQLENRGGDLQKIEKQTESAKEDRDKLMDERRELHRQEARLKTVVNNAQEELRRAEQTLSHTSDRRTSSGLAAVRRMKQQHNLTGAYGTLAELFEVPSTYKTAAEICAGSSLFNYVVDTVETAEKIIEQLKREKSGRLNFMPLDRLRNKRVDFPQATDAVPLISRLSYDPKYEAAMQNVFGKTIICPNLQVATQYARSHGISAISVQGDRAEKKGAMTGGYHEPKNSRIDATRNVARCRAEVESQNQQMNAVTTRLSKLEQEINKSLSNVMRFEQESRRMEYSYGPLRSELKSKSADLQGKRDALEQNRTRHLVVENVMRQLREQQGAFEDELGSDFKKALTAQEEQQLQHLESTVQDLRGQYTQVRSSMSDVEVRKTDIEIELSQNLRLRLDQLNSVEYEGGGGELSGASSRNVATHLQDRQKQLKRVQKAMKTLEQKLVETDNQIEQVQAQLNKQQAARDEKMIEQEGLAKAIERHQKRLERSIVKKTQYTERAAEAARNIRDLGVLPEEAFTKYNRMSSEAASKRLTKVNEALKKFAHVNKKAFEQYNNFTKQREMLTKRREELDTSRSSIQELIEVLDQRKDEAIQRTFRQVSKEFATVFEKLVPAGKGQLVMQRRTEKDPRVDDDEEDDAERRSGAVSNYTGVAISVSFNSKHDEQQRIQQLSGGQKSLCALALVFAIQQCDPAPFYLFDEIDANLDAQYRTAVAAMIEQLSETGQFICTTFRPEMVLKAEKCYGVSYSNKTSSIDVVNRDDALEFVEGQKQ